MIKDLLDVNKIKFGGQLPLDIKECHLHSILQDVIAGYLISDLNQIELTCDENIVGYWDPDAINRIFDNLINNALKYGDKTEPVNVSCETKGERVLIKVHNSGDPISLKDQGAIFNDFLRIETVQSRGKEGWGLGLTLVKGLTSVLGGTISLTSEEVVGTTFLVDLPLDSREKKN